MKFIFLSAFIAAISFSKNIEVNMDISIDTTSPISTKIILEEGKPAFHKAVRKGKEVLIKLTATESTIEDKEGIFLDFEISKKNENGKREVMASPKIISKNESNASITMSGGYSKESLEINLYTKLL